MSNECVCGCALRPARGSLQYVCDVYSKFQLKLELELTPLSGPHKAMVEVFLLTRYEQANSQLHASTVTGPAPGSSIYLLVIWVMVTSY